MEVRRPGGRKLRLTALAVAWVVVVVGAVAVGVANTQDAIAADAVAALERAGIEVETVHVEGRDVLVTAPRAAHADIEAALVGIERLGTLELADPDDDVVVASDEPPGTSAPPFSSPPESTTPEKVASRLPAEKPTSPPA